MKKHMYLLVKALLISLLICIFSMPSKGQDWKSHWEKLSVGDGYEPYFINEKVGFGESSRTTDGGATWKSIDLPGRPYFVNDSHGYCAKLNVYETFDTGTTWKKIRSGETVGVGNHWFSSIYGTENHVYAIENQSILPGSGQVLVLMSSDHGDHWDTVNKPMHIVPFGMVGTNFPAYEVFGNKDDLVYAAIVDSSNYWKYSKLYFSTNSGRDWSFNTFDTVVGSYACTQNPTSAGWYCSPHCDHLVRTFKGLDYDATDTYSIQHSTDHGKTWEIYPPEMEIGGEIAGDGNVIYVCNANEYKTRGLLRSIDFGKTWTEVPGPAFDEIDEPFTRNLSVVGGGKVIYAYTNVLWFNGDYVQGLWKSVDGGDAKPFLTSTSRQYSLTLPKGVIEKRHDSSAVIPIYLKRTEPLPALEFYIRYADNDYTYVGTFTRTGISVDVASGSTVGIAKVRFPASTLIPDGDSLIGYSLIKLKAFEPFCSMVYFDSARFDNNSGSCEGQPVITGTQLYLGNYYGCGGIMESISDAPSAMQNFSVYPNPAGNTIMLESTVDVGDLVLEMRDQLGKTIISRHEHLQASSPIPFDVSSLPKGIYYLRIDHDGKIVTKKIVISR